MMVERVARQTVCGTVMRATAALLAAGALLWQLLAVPPLAMRMLSGPTAGIWRAAFCSSDPAGPPGVPAPQPASTHDHDGCPLCQSHSVPLAPIAFGVLIVAVVTNWRWVCPACLVAPAPAAPFRLYSPRAPPALA
jgi:hypothetical protein